MNGKGEKMKGTYNIMLLIALLTLAVIASVSTVKVAHASTGIYYAVEPSQILFGPSPAIDQTFQVTVKLYNATTSMVSTGVGGVEIHLAWNKTLIQPVSFTSDVGVAGVGPLTGPSILYGINAGFYDDLGNVVASAPYTNATHYNVAGASTGAPWYGDNATVAVITFKVISQPWPYATCPLQLDFADMTDANAIPVSFSIQNAVYTITSEQAAPYTVTYSTTNYTGSILSDSTTTAPSFDSTAGTLSFNVTSPVNGTLSGFCNVTVPLDMMSGTWTFSVDGGSSSAATKVTDETNNYVSFSVASGTHAIVLHSTIWVPEFPMTSLILLLMGTTLIGAAVAKRFRRKASYS